MTVRISQKPFGTRTTLNVVQVLYDGDDSSNGNIGYLDLNPLFAKGQVNLGIQIQAIGCPVSIDTTLVDPLIAVDPNHSENVAAIWVELEDSMTNDKVGFFEAATALRFRFQGTTEGQVLIGTC